MRYFFGVLCLCALGVVPLVGCSETGDTGGSAGAGGAGGTGGATPPKACINDDDLAIICDYEFVDTARECGIDASFDCRPGQDDVVAQCVAANSSECVQVATGMGEACVDCFGATIACVEANCPSCGSSPDGQECLACRDGTCNDSLYECAGDIVDGCDGEVWCQRVDCDDLIDCTEDVCNPVNGLCNSVPLDDGTPCDGGVCQSTACALTDMVLPCTEQAIRNAIAAGGGPYTFDCDDPTVLETKAELVIDNNVILDGDGHLTVDGKDEHRVLSVAPGIRASLTGFGITGGRDVGLINQGGTLWLTDCVIRGNAGNGISNEGTMIATSCTVAENEGIGIQNGETMILTNSHVSQNDGGLLNAGTATIFDSTVSGNFGGGIENWGTLSLATASIASNEYTGIINTGILAVWSCTVSDNSGGGIHASGVFDCGGTMAITNSTVSGNEGDALYACGSTTITHSTVSGRVVADGQDSSIDIAATLIDGACSQQSESISWTSSGHNLESPGNTCGFDEAKGDQFNVSAGQLNLGPLQNNGGPTETHALQTEPVVSAAIDTIPGASCVVNEDQRSEPRPQTGGSMCDVGAFEVQPEP
jgi:hypothetical protein